MTGRRVSVAIWAALIALALPAASQAAFPGQNGRIAFTGTSPSSAAVDVYSAEPGGAGLARLTSDGISDNPVFSPDGSQLAFTSGGKVYIGDQYANNRQLVLDAGVGSYELDWSPDGTKLVAAFPNCVDFDCEPDLYVFGVDGSGLTNLTNTASPEYNPAWSPDGSKIAFDSPEPGGGGSDVYTMNPDGTGVQNITTDLVQAAMEPDWSPDGSQIAYEYGGEIVAANPDGSNRVHKLFGHEPAWSPDGARFAYTLAAGPPVSTSAVDVTGPHPDFHGSLGFGRSADWQVRQPDPVPPAGGIGFPRAKGATPVSVALVLNYNRCNGGAIQNKQHGPPLAYPSCTPTRTGSTATVGTPDSNGLLAEAEGRVRFDTVLGDPTTVADEADVRIHVQQTDVRRDLGGTYPDYAGALVLFAPLRVTDLWNAGGGTDGSGTMVDFPLRVAVPCVATPGPEGGTCSIETTVDAVTPGFVRERKRMLLQLGQVLVHYAGADSDPYTLNDNRPLFAQGVFVP